MTDLRVSDVSFTRAPDWWRDKAFVGWASCVVDDAMGVGGLGLRRTRDGEILLSFPCRNGLDSHAQDHDWPLYDEARRAFETQVLGELQRQGKIP